MTGSPRLSRLNPVYLAARNGGAFFLCLALGMAGGLAYQTLVEPREFVATATGVVAVMPPGSGTVRDWESAGKRFGAAFLNADRRLLMSANLRYAVKISLAEPDEPSAGALRDALLAYREPVVMDTSPWDRVLPPFFGFEFAVGQGDLAANIDLQSLASILADLYPPTGGSGWDFSFFAPREPAPVVARIDPEDPCFAVFSRIHELRAGGGAGSPDDAWRSAVMELNERILRETEFQGGGGFGERAVRELLRELNAVPVLAANGLYGPVARYFGASDLAPWERELWDARWAATRVRVDGSDSNHARLTIEMPNTMSPLRFPADSPLTRIDRLAVETALQFLFLNAGTARPDPMPDAEPARMPETAPERPELPPPVQDPDPNPPVGTREPARQIIEPPRRNDQLDQAFLSARTTRDELLLRYEKARGEAETAAFEAGAARERADRIEERLDGLEMRGTGMSTEKTVDPEVAELRRLCAEIRRRLETLLQTCTEEHPFVRAARRELAAAENRLLLADDGTPEAAARERAVGLGNLRLEWKVADESARVLADRRAHADDAAECLLRELVAAGARLSGIELELARSAVQPGIRVEALDRVADNIGLVARALTDFPVVVPAPAPPAPTPAPETEAEKSLPARSPPSFVFSPLAPEVSVLAEPLSARPLEIGAGLGLALGLFWVLLHELFGARLTNAFEARRWADVPILASIPRYDAKSLALGARSLGVKLEAGGGRRTLVPPSIDVAEAAPLGKRRRLAFHRASRRWRAFAVGVVILLLAAALRQVVVGDAWRLPSGDHPLIIREGRR
ncbi:MAG: hypothetical protein LBJ46_02875 [Planctomycetota bacterium]|jgi:hypothetical protein|nr:hypothetical protein [Planctomycetota bacterium]